jgi:HK97 family phage portal protein
MSWKDTIREKALIFLNADGSSSNSPRWPTAYPAAQAQFFFPNWPDENPAVPLTERRELINNSLIMTPINWLGTVLSEPPPVVEIEQADGTYEPAIDSPMLDLLATPNAYHTGELLLKAFAYSWVVYGNVYWYKARNASGQVVELWPLDAANVYPYTDTTKNEFISYYVYKPPIGTEQYLAPSDLVHFRCGLDPRDSRLGLAPIEALWLELAADVALTKYTQAMAQNFGVPPYCVSPEPDPTGTYQLSAELMKSEITKGTTGSNTGKMLTFERPVRIVMMGMSPDQLAVDKSRRIPEERVASVLCIPGVVLGYGSHLDRATYSNVATARRMAYEGCVNPILNLIAAVLREQLLIEFVPRETIDNYWVRFDMSDIAALKEDTNDLYKREVEAFKNGITKRSESRAQLGLPSDPEDEIYSPMAQGHAAGGFQFGSAREGEEKSLANPTEGELRDLDKWFEAVAPEDAQGLLDAKAK